MSHYEEQYEKWMDEKLSPVLTGGYQAKSGSKVGSPPSGGSAVSALHHQEGGSHYKEKAIQPVEYCMANGIGFMEGSVIKYVTRWKDKGGVQDLKKARHFLDLLIENEEAKK